MQNNLKNNKIYNYIENFEGGIQKNKLKLIFFIIIILLLYIILFS